MRRLVVTLVLCLTCFLLSAVAAEEPAPKLQGYSDEAARSERDWEAKFQAIPSNQNMRDYDQRLSARPHHVGSPYDKDNAEWILSQFKSWGLDAHIEQYDVLSPAAALGGRPFRVEPAPHPPNW